MTENKFENLRDTLSPIEKTIYDKLDGLIAIINKEIPTNSREKSLAFTKLEEFLFWISKALMYKSYAEKSQTAEKAVAPDKPKQV